MDVLVFQDDFNCHDLFEHVFGSFSQIQKHEIPLLIENIMNDPLKSRDMKWAASKFLDNEKGYCHPFIDDILLHVRRHIVSQMPSNQLAYTGTPDHNIVKSSWNAPITQKTQPRNTGTQKQLFQDVYHYYDSSSDSSDTEIMEE